MKILKNDNMLVGSNAPLLIIAGPCVIEDFETTRGIAAYLKDVTADMGLNFVFKASYDKANRTSISSFRGPGMDQGLDILHRIKQALGIKLLSDVHHPVEVEAAAAILDILQIPALLCRQTDLLTAAANTACAVNIKKGQFLAPWDMCHVIEKVTASGNNRVLVTERGSQFGYNNLVVDFRGLKIIQQMGTPVIFDATHSVQLPGGAGEKSDGQREFAPVLAKAAVAAGADGVFLEVHPEPEKALCDGPNSLPLDCLPKLLKQLIAIRKAVTTIE
ncbi:MAG: 3-deoxy-8-phosphooctulonate synthase [Desulfobacteraceae bacterium]|nr:3-deoxy-8-phosphooctulonate synthase [Desulfobacteraceae bacterium]